MKYLIDIAYLFALLVISPKVLYRVLRHGRYRGGWGERLGGIQRRRPEQPCIWIHAVSVGEVNATRTLVERLRKVLPEYEVVISATTDTGLARAKALYDRDLAIFYYPFDLSWVVRRAFRRIRPSICLLMELEVWPNFAARAEHLGVPVVVVNGRLSDRSFPRYRLIRGLTRRMFSKVRLILAQTREYADRFEALGCPPEKVQVTSSLKYDTAQIADTVAGAEELARQLALDGDSRLWVAGGTGPGEEAIVLDVFARLRRNPALGDLRLAIVPRKPERFDEVAAMIANSGFDSVRYSEVKDGQRTVAEPATVILGDTMGDLKKFYSLASGGVFVGRSLVPMGGSDMMESTALGKCTLFGPHTFNFRQTVEELLAGEGAIEVADAEGLYRRMEQCLSDREFARRIARNGREVIRRNQGATERTVAAIHSILKPAEPVSSAGERTGTA